MPAITLWPPGASRQKLPKLLYDSWHISDLKFLSPPACPPDRTTPTFTGSLSSESPKDFHDECIRTWYILIPLEWTAFSPMPSQEMHLQPRTPQGEYPKIRHAFDSKILSGPEHSYKMNKPPCFIVHLRQAQRCVGTASWWPCQLQVR